VLIFAHRGFSSRQPEMTRAAYHDAIAWAAEEGVELGLECDVSFSADDELICLHDLTLDRTSDATGPVFGRTVAELRKVDFGFRLRRPTPDQAALVTLEELMSSVAVARATGVLVTLAIETKHPNPRGLAIEDRVATLLGSYGWDGAGSPVRVISFHEPALVAIGRLVPAVQRTFLIEVDFGRFADGHLPEGVHAVGPDLALVKQDPDFVARARAHGNEVHVWTVNRPADIELCLDLGVTGLTTDYPDRVLAALRAAR
jgi:glycerophosphoryl diester phosphodiesterase